MLITIIYRSGCVEDFSTPPLGTSFGGGCILENTFLHIDDMYAKGIRLSAAYVSTHTTSEEPLMREYMLVEPEGIPLVYKVMKDSQEIMAQDEAGKLLNPVEYDAFLREAMRDK